MSHRTRTTVEQRNQLKANFLAQFNKCYDCNLDSPEAAVLQFKRLSRTEKRLFDWIALDRSINHPSYSSKSFSYKFINEVVAAEFTQQIKLVDIQDTALHQIYKYKIDLSKSKQELIDLRKQIVQDTLFAVFGVQSRDKNYYQRKQIVDSLNYFILKRIENILLGKEQRESEKGTSNTSELYEEKFESWNSLFENDCDYAGFI
ncbi:Hypothetical_protein [Hexamita inflata]|uniref:Hypothetical_protein n=1 Tax=Hexamita inflata TaxID=28002 RepID=A0AA86P9D4_9EUKA|nr:Hypothetical protein HINF_LOCUS20519 [Hexamita inflata]CAI9934546.1 Hypothetical protein HINF_LOCUS22191 [Hexamita inflata]